MVDSERLMAQFKECGYNVFHDSDDVKGEIVVVNTCGFIGDAKEESIEMILSMAEAKKRHKIGRLFVMGCLSERYREELKTEIPEVDRFYGKFDWDTMANDVCKTGALTCSHVRMLTTPPHYAYIKIAEGCNRTCSYCAIPLITGKYKSRPMEDIIDEVRTLASQGVKELQLIAQDLTYYGLDLYKENRLATLVQRLSEIKGIGWIRLHYGYPAHFPYDILPVMRENPKVCAYLDVALQHISDHMLTLMHRNVTKDDTYAFIKRLRDEVPGLHLRTTLLVGHPGETEEDFAELMQFVKDARFEHMGAFAYSDEEGTFANINYTDNVPDDVKQARVDRIMALQETIAAEINAEKTGQTMRVMLDREENDFYVGRTEYDSPEVDGEVLIEKSKTLTPGEMYDIEITGADTYDLYGRVKR